MVTCDQSTECETCQGNGMVPITDTIVLDRGTRWQRSIARDDVMECPDCDGTGVVNNNESEKP